MGNTDADLVCQFECGDDRAFAALYHRHKRQIYGYCLRMVGDVEMAKDVTQRVFVKLFESRERASLPDCVGAWLYTVARHDCRHELERLGRMTGPEHGELEVDNLSARQWALEIEGKSLENAVSVALGRLRFDDRELLTLREYEGRSYREIAECLGISESAVRFRLHVARRRLYDILKPVFRVERHS